MNKKFSDLLSDRMKDPEFKKEYIALSKKITTKPPLICRIKRKIIFKQPNECCKLGLKPLKELTKCMECEQCNEEFFED